MPGGGGSTRKVRTPVLPRFGKAQLLRLVGMRGPSSKALRASGTPEHPGVQASAESSAAPSGCVRDPGAPAQSGRVYAAGAARTAPWRARRPDLPSWTSERQSQVPVQELPGALAKRRLPLGIVSRSPSVGAQVPSASPAAAAGAAEGQGRLCACAGKAALPAAAAAPPPPPARTARPRPRRRPEPPLSSLAFASRVSCRPPSPGWAPGAAAERLPAGERLRARTGAGGGGPVRRGCAGKRRARRRRPPSRRLLACSPPPALRWLPPLLGVIDPSRAPPPPPRPF